MRCELAARVASGILADDCPLASHQWFDYYGTDYWVGKIDAFLDGSGRSQAAKL